MDELATTLRNAAEGQTLHLETSGDDITGTIIEGPSEHDPDPSSPAPQSFDTQLRVVLADAGNGQYDQWKLTMDKHGTKWQAPTVSGTTNNDGAIDVGTIDTVESAEVVEDTEVA